MKVKLVRSREFFSKLIQYRKKKERKKLQAKYKNLLDHIKELILIYVQQCKQYFL